MSSPILAYFIKKISTRLKLGSHSKAGRNYTGRICVFHRGGGVKRSLKSIDLIRRVELFGRICAITYDAYRTS